MYKLKVHLGFSAAHFLRDYKGKCEDLHGHNWKVEVQVKADKLNSIGLAMDFGDLKKELKAVLEKLDHKFLNDLDYFKEKNPSSETIAVYIYEELKERVNRYNCRLDYVGVWEQEGSCAIYEE